MRGTVHTVSARDFALFGAALAGDPPGWVTPASWSRSPSEVGRAVARVLLASPRTRSEVLTWLERERGVPNDGSNGIWYAIRLRSPDRALGRVQSLAAPPIRNPTFVALEHDEQDGEAARAALVRRYLAAFGPATRAEISGWSGLQVGRLRAPARGPASGLRDDSGRELLDLPRAPRAGRRHTRAGAAAAEVGTTLLLDRQRVLPEELPQARRAQERRRPADVSRSTATSPASGASRSGES